MRAWLNNECGIADTPGINRQIEVLNWLIGPYEIRYAVTGVNFTG